MRQAQIHVTAMGANTSLGPSVTACAAARAGLTRPAPLDQDVFDADENPIPVIGHPVPTVAGFHGEARLLALALPALLDLVEGVGAEALAGAGLFMALPDLPARAGVADVPAPSSIGLVDRLCVTAGLAPPPAVTRTFIDGPVGLALALQAGMALLASGQASSAIVGAVDSLCDDVALGALAVQGRLKTGDSPLGLQPGEAAAFLLLQSTDGVRRHARTPLGSIACVGLGRESVGGDQQPRGRGLADAVMQTVSRGGPLPVGKTWFVVDLNGEAARAQDWANGYLQLAARIPEPPGLPDWYPATSFGDTGAASAALSVQMAIRGFARAHAPGRCAVVLSSSEDGKRAAVRVEGPAAGR